MEKKNKEWERVPGETQKAFEAFCIYRDMGASRSLQKVADRLGKCSRLIKKWSSQDGWVKRTTAYDDYMDRKARGVVESKLEDINSEHLNMIRGARESVMVPLQALLKRIDNASEKGGDPFSDFDDKPLDKLLDMARPYVKLVLDVIKLERLMYGLPTETIKAEGTIGHEVSHDIRVVNEYIESLTEDELVRIINDARRSGH